MSHRRKLAIAAIVIGAICAALLLWPVLVGDTRHLESEADPGAVVAVRNTTVILPERAGNPAALHFEIENLGERAVFVSEVGIAHGGRAEFVDATGLNSTPMANFKVEAGATRTFGPGGPHAVLTGYDENVVPGAQLPVRFVFGNADMIDVEATVQTAGGSEGAESR